MTKYLAVGDLLINPDLLAYVAVESDQEDARLRLGFGAGVASRSELRLAGEEARAVLRWLRRNATFLDQASVLGPTDRPPEPAGPAQGSERVDGSGVLDMGLVPSH